MFEGRRRRRSPNRRPAPRREPSASVAPCRSTAYDEAISARPTATSPTEVHVPGQLHAAPARPGRRQSAASTGTCVRPARRYAAYLDLGRFRVLSASPELFFRSTSDRVVTKPMKGTAPRGRWLAEDEANRERLLGPAKDRAENAMIVDLLRNDARPHRGKGSVTWADVFETERFDTVWQLTSTVAAGSPRGRPLPTSSARCSVRQRDRRTQRSPPWGSSPTSRTRRAGSIAARSGSSRRAATPDAGALQRRDPHGRAGRGDGGGGVRRRRGHHLGFGGRRRIRRGRGEGSGPHRRPSLVPTAREPPARPGHRLSPPPPSTSPACATRCVLRLRDR